MPKYEHDNWGDISNTIFAKGVITAVDGENDTADITVQGYQDGTDVPIFYHCDPDSEERDNGAIEGAASGFAVDDEVIVMCEADTGNPIRIIGFASGIKECCIFSELYPYDEETWSGLWTETTYCHDGWAYVSCGGSLTTSFTFNGEHDFEFIRGGCGGHGSPQNVQVQYQQTLDDYRPLHEDTNYFLLVDLEDYLISFSGGGVNATITCTYFGLLLSRISDGAKTSVRMYFGITNDNTLIVATHDASGNNQTSGIFYANVLTVLQYGYPTTTIEEWEIAGVKLVSYANANSTNYNCLYQSSISVDCNSIKVCSKYPSESIPAYYDALAYGW